MRRVRALAYWTLPSLLCLAVFWPGLRAWFQQDDFAWLGLGATVHDVPSLFRALFEPMAQGTIRPFSERAFFMLFHAAFGLWATPFRAVAFLTQFANLALLGLLVGRITRSPAAGFLAPLLWAANGGLAVAMSWTSAYNQLLCGTTLLAALYCFVRYAEAGDRRFFIAQWVVFLLGFGVLEVNAVYPLLAAAYALACSRAYLRKTWPMFAVSAAYTVLHFWVAPVRATGSAYTMHFDGSLFATFATYWRWALGPGRVDLLLIGAPRWLGIAGVAVLTLALLAFVGWKLLKRDWATLLPVIWFAVVLMPVLPLRDHISAYYLTLPSAGVAWLGALALTSAFRGGRSWKALALALAGIYLVAGVMTGRTEAQVLTERSHVARTVVLGAGRIHELHPNTTIVFTGLESELVWIIFASKPFPLVGASEVYIGPDDAARVQPRVELGRASDFAIPSAILLDLLNRRRAVVYQPEDGRLRAVTISYYAHARKTWIKEEPRRVDVGQPAFADQLGPTWYEIYAGRRWMPRRATVRLGGPRTPFERLFVSGFCPAPQVRGGPLSLTVGFEGTPARMFRLTAGDAKFELAVDIPQQLVGKPQVEIVLEVERTYFAPPDRRELGLSFGTLEIR